jgi:hypothetical protein
MMNCIGLLFLLIPLLKMRLFSCTSRPSQLQDKGPDVVFRQESDVSVFLFRCGSGSPQLLPERRGLGAGSVESWLVISRSWNLDTERVCCSLLSLTTSVSFVFPSRCTFIAAMFSHMIPRASRPLLRSANNTFRASPSTLYLVDRIQSRRSYATETGTLA